METYRRALTLFCFGCYFSEQSSYRDLCSPSNALGIFHEVLREFRALGAPRRASAR
jgi:hypothetical protein